MNERDLIDMTIKQFTRPALYIDTHLLMVELGQIKQRKAKVLEELNVSKEQVMSDAKFADLLLDRQVVKFEDLPFVTSKTDGKFKLSFSKQNPDVFNKLMAIPECKPYIEARLMLKSTLEETRIERLLSLRSEKSLDRFVPLCVPLMYYGAATTGRFSGRDRLNLQNLGRKSAIRAAIVPPEGHKIVAADLSQIEARLTACFCGQTDLVDAFRSGEDVYASFASAHYGFKVNAEDHPVERFVGKTGILSLGFQSGYEKFADTMNNVFKTPIALDDAASVVSTYRRRYKKIPQMWYFLQEKLPFMENGAGEMEVGPVTLGDKKIVLPNNMSIDYVNLRRSAGNREWIYDSAHQSTTKIYGGKMLENIVQALARIIMTTAELRLAEHGRMAALSVHDELVFVVKEDHVPLVSKAIKAVMEYPVEWMQELPIKCEIKVGDNYGECK